MLSLLVKLQFRKLSVSELVSWTIPQSGGYNTATCFRD